MFLSHVYVDLPRTHPAWEGNYFFTALVKFVLPYLRTLLVVLRYHTDSVVYRQLAEHLLGVNGGNEIQVVFVLGAGDGLVTTLE